MSKIKIHESEGNTPISEEFEKIMDTVTAKALLNAMKNNLGIQFTEPPNGLTEYDCRRICRVIIRQAKDYVETIH